jgi:CubicO group peptidase (beta-lactamase class C family)
MIGLLAAWCIPSTASAETAGHEPADIGPMLELFIARNKVPGMAAIAIRGDRVVALGAAGVRKLGAPERVTKDDEFEICSCAKPMTATLAAMLIDEGKLRWDSTLGEVLGPVVTGMQPGWRAVTLRELLDHRSGIAQDPIYVFLAQTTFSNASLPRQRLNSIGKLLSRAPDFAPGTKFAYVSANYVVAAVMIERVTGRAWEDLMRERIFRPLGMATAGFGPPQSGPTLAQPWGHGYSFYLHLIGFRRPDAPIDPTSAWADAPLAAAPAGLVHMSVRDWAKFVAFQLRGDAANPHREVILLEPATLARLNQPETSQSVPANWGAGRCACDWVVSSAAWAKGNRPGDTGRILWHQGDNARWNTSAWIAPELDLAVIVACNRGGVWNHCTQVARALIDEFATGPGRPGDNLDGHWEGSLTPWVLDDHRIDLEISSASAGNRNAFIVDLAHSGSPVAVTALTERDGAIHLETSKGGVYEARVNADKSEIAGTWKQGRYVGWVVLKRALRPELTARE